MFFSPQEYNKKLFKMIAMLIATGVAPAAILVVALPVLDTLTSKIIVAVAVIIMIVASFRTAVSSVSAFVSIASRRRLITRVFRATVKIVNAWKEPGDIRLNFLGGSFLTIVQTDARAYELTVHHADGSVVGYRLIPWSLRALNEAPVMNDEVSTLIDELELRARHQMSVARPVPLRQHTDA